MIGRPFNKPKPAHWHLKKSRAMYLNRRQSYEFDPPYSTAVEITLEQSTEASPIYLYNEANNAYIITE